MTLFNGLLCAGLVSKRVVMALPERRAQMAAGLFPAQNWSGMANVRCFIFPGSKSWVLLYLITTHNLMVRRLGALDGRQQTLLADEPVWWGLLG